MTAGPATLPVVLPTLSMLGDAEAAACEGDACLIPGARPADAATAADESSAASLARVRDAIDSGRAI